MLLLTVPHELVDLLGAALRSVHAVILLQQLVHLGQVDAGVRRHAVGGDLPQQHTECWRCRHKTASCAIHTINNGNTSRAKSLNCKWWEGGKQWTLVEEEPEIKVL